MNNSASANRRWVPGSSAQGGIDVTPRFQVADRIVYCVTKNSRHPARSARLVVPAENGDEYSYCVDKYWVIDAVLPDGKLVAKTRRGKLHELSPDDPKLRHATRLECLLWRRGEDRVVLRYLTLGILTLVLVVTGYFLFGIVVA